MHWTIFVQYFKSITCHHVNDHWLDQTCNRKFITPCKKEEERIALISILVENTKCLVWFKTLYQFYDFVCYSQNKTLNYASLTFKLPLRLSAICPFYSFAFIEKPQSYKSEPNFLLLGLKCSVMHHFNKKQSNTWQKSRFVNSILFELYYCIRGCWHVLMG